MIFPMRARSRPMFVSRVLAVVAFLLWGAAAAFAQGNGQTADDPTAAFFKQLDPTLEAARVIIDTPDSDAAELEALREKLLAMRDQALAAEKAATAVLNDANARMTALAPAPADGASEPPEMAAHRADLAKAVAAAQLPVLRAQEAARDITDLISALDKQVWTRVSAQLRTLGPSPVLPDNILRTISQVTDRLGDARAEATKMALDPATQKAVTRKLPRNLALLGLGLALTFVLRRRLTQWTERRLAQASTPRAIAWLVALRNISRLLLPAVGAGLLFAALDPTMLNTNENLRLFSLPPFILAIIGSGWLADSLFSPGLAQYRLIPVPDDAAARRGAKLTRMLGWVLAAHFFIVNHLGSWEMTPAVNATFTFPLTVIGGYGLWRVGALMRSLKFNLNATQANLPAGQHMGSFGLGLTAFMERAVWGAALAAPVLAAIGFFAAAQGLLYSMILTLALIGANIVLFDLIYKTGATFAKKRHEAVGTPEQTDGLGPVVAVAALALLSAPVLALIWGARQSDLISFWILLRDGVSLGGVRISASVILSFLLVFSICYAITRAVQSVLGNSVLPRTRMDAGGKNAVMSGVGYVGFTIAGFAAISATGIDLSSIAIVAGALSVGIGFGLQNVVSNFVSGIILLVERPIKEGDWIEVGTYSGYVRRISVRSTEIETFDRASVILPNSDLIAGAVLNRTHKAMLGRLQVMVSVAYGADARQVARILTEIAEDHPMTLRDPEPRVLFMGFGPDSMDFEIRCVLRDVNFSLSSRSDMNFEIAERFKEAGIRLQFWQRELPPSAMATAGEPAATPVGPGPIAGVVKQA